MKNIDAGICRLLIFIALSGMNSFAGENQGKHPIPCKAIIPAYPELPAYAGLSGEVILEFSVNKNGDTVDFKKINGNENLYRFSCYFLAKWKYPKSDVAMSNPYRMTVKYELSDADKLIESEIELPNLIVLRGHLRHLTGSNM